jgi:hypothetical protein
VVKLNVVNVDTEDDDEQLDENEIFIDDQESAADEGDLFDDY